MTTKQEIEILNYCKPFVATMWAAQISSIIIGGDFRDMSDHKIDEYILSKGIECDICLQMKPDTEHRIDPYSFEILGDNSKKNLCNDCTDQRRQNIP